jgi:hydrogenase large subunit
MPKIYLPIDLKSGQPEPLPTPSPTASPTPTAGATATPSPAPGQRLVIDPITRIEGHLRLETSIAYNRVADAWSSGTMFRGLELVLQGRDPRDAWIFAQRICGVCTTVHAVTSVRAVENALGIAIPENARLMRHLITGAQFVQDHIVHFYHLHAPDWADLANALSADPQVTSRLAQSISAWPNNSAQYFTTVQARFKSFIDSGQLGIFGNAYWGHSAYKLPAEANLLLLAHYLEALGWQREIIKVQAILGGKNPHPQTYLVGGMALPVDPNSAAALNGARIAELRRLITDALTFVKQVYLPDLMLAASYYKDWANLGAGCGNYLAYGDFGSGSDSDPSTFWLPRGIVLGKDLSKAPQPLDPNLIGEYVTHSWYTYAGGDQTARHPSQGETQPTHTGPQPPYDHLNVDGKYSWLKSPRYGDRTMEVGPLARMTVAYAAGHSLVRARIDEALRQLGLNQSALFSTLGRILARGIETQLIAEQMLVWLDALEANMNSSNLAVHNGALWDPATWPTEAAGWGAGEAPRGALGHWVSIQNGRIAHYQVMSPSTWNGSPRDAHGQPGAWEQALVGTPVTDPGRPLEILRTVHAFDPCLACAVHVTDNKGGEVVRVKVV